MTNRIEQAIADTEKRLADLPQEKLDSLHKTCEMSLEEYILFQEIKSLAAGSKMSMEEALTIYGHLGESLADYETAPLAAKIVLTMAFKELMELRIAGRKETA